MKVLFLYPYLPSPDAAHGSARLVSRLLRDLRDRVEITLVCAFRPGEAELLESVRPLCAEVIPVERPFGDDLKGVRRSVERATTVSRLMTTGFPTPVVKLRRQGFRRALAALLARRRFDVAHVELSVMAQYVDHLGSSPTVLVDHEAGGASQHETARWDAYVRAVYPRFSRVLTLTPEDRDDLNAMIPNLNIGVRAPGVSCPAMSSRRPEPGRVLFFGSPGHGPNLDALRWLAEDIAPRLTRKGSGVRLVCAGIPRDHELAAIATAAGIEVLGFVDDLSVELDRASVVLAPIREGRGIRIKNLEAMAHGAPLVTTTLGTRGIGAVDGVTCVVADSPLELGSAVLALLADPQRAEALGRAGRALVLERFTEQQQAADTLALWESLVTGVR